MKRDLKKELQLMKLRSDIRQMQQMLELMALMLKEPDPLVNRIPSSRQ